MYSEQCRPKPAEDAVGDKYEGADPIGAEWITSSHSGGGSCVEVAAVLVVGQEVTVAPIAEQV